MAAVAGWDRVRDGAGLAVGRSRQRVRSTRWPIVQCALGAALAWEVATRLLGHSRPFFAAVAAVVCLGTAGGQRLRRVGELGVGVTLGVVLGDLVVQVIGRGGWQIALTVGIAMLVAQTLVGGTLITGQAALQAILVITLPQTPDGDLARWLDALTGAGVALAVAALLPADPAREVRERAAGLLDELAEVVGQAARAIREQDAAIADAALDRARATQSGLDSWAQAQAAGEEGIRTSPLLRGRRAEVARLDGLLVGVDRATRNMRVGVRRVAAALDVGEQLPEALAEVLDDLVHALGAMRAELFEAATRGRAAVALSALAPRLDPATLGARTLSSTVLVAQVRSAVVDLLGASGVQHSAARDLLP
jgi:uncharacterized membrane protein YgaE (UPF0421/DUF939 family)